MREIDFYQGHLDQVSRSFAFCIRKLSRPMRDWTSLSYLLCRVLDTIEDSPWPDPELRETQYREFNQFLVGELPGGAAGWATGDFERAVASWAARFPAVIAASERDLLAESAALFEDLRALPAQVRSLIEESVLLMAAGMRHYSERQSREGELRLRSLEDVNRYCYFVAGTVGELLSRLYLASGSGFEFAPPAAFSLNAVHFGLFLQKVNLLKDQRSDEAQGRFLVPGRELLLWSLRENARGSIAYLTSLPPSEAGYRTFCAWSLFLGAASLPFMQAAHARADGSRIPRAVTEQLLSAVERMASRDDELRRLLGEKLEWLPEEPALPPEESASSEVAIFDALTGGRFTPAQLSGLRLSSTARSERPTQEPGTAAHA